MDESCPVCGDPYEYVDDRGDMESASQSVIEVEELCRVDEDRRWDRICVRATTGDGGNPPVLEEYRHHWEDD